MRSRTGAAKVVTALALVAALAPSAACDSKRAGDSGTPPATNAPGELPVLNDVGAFSLVDQEGRPFTQNTLKGKVWAAAFMFTRCPSICPALTAAMRDVQDDAKRTKTPLHLVSFSVDPDNDQPPVLDEYAKKHQADLASWSFATGDFSVIKKTSEEGFKVALAGKPDPDKDHFGITHGSHLILVDQQGRIRGYYRSSEKAALKRLVVDAASLNE